MAKVLETEIQKRFSDVDPFQHVNNVSQQMYFDVGKMEYYEQVLGDEVLLGDLRIITGQQPCVTRAKKSIAGFHVREGQPIGCKVTLRGDRMWEFLDRLLATALPRVRDFRGISPTSFDGRGNYTMGVTEQLIFSEIDYDKIDRTRGMDITFVTTARDDDSAFALLDALGFPFKDKE